MNMRTHRKLALKAFILMIAVAAFLWANEKGPPDGETGCLGDGTCARCHRDFPLDSGRGLEGTFDILGVPDLYTPGETYTITVQLGQPGQVRWGFELAARFMDRTQAGEIIPTDLDNTQVSQFRGVTFIKHTLQGTFDETPDGPVQWQFDWTAPDCGTVLFCAAGNAADGDRRPIGDYIYTAQVSTQPADPKD